MGVTNVHFVCISSMYYCAKHSDEFDFIYPKNRLKEYVLFKSLISLS